MTARTAKQPIQDAEFTDINKLPPAPEFNEYDETLPENTPDDIAMLNILADMGESENAGKVNVYKLVDGVFRNQMFLFECMPSEFNMGLLQNPDYHNDEKEKHMFRVILRNSTGIATAKTLTVMPIAKKNIEVLPPALDLTPFAAIMAQQQENFNRMFATLTANNAPANTEADILSRMAQYKALFGGNDRQAPSTSPLEVLALAKELADVMNPEASQSGMGVMMKLLETFGKPIAEAVSAMPLAQPQPRAMPRQQNPVDTAQAIEKPTNEGNDDMGFMLTQSLNFLINQAKRDADPQLYADLVLDQAGDDINALLTTPDWFEKLKTLAPGVAPYEKWFTELKDEISLALTERAKDDTTEPENIVDINEAVKTAAIEPELTLNENINRNN